MPDFNQPRLLSLLAARRQGKPAPAPEAKAKAPARKGTDHRSILQEVLAERKTRPQYHE